MPNILIVSNRLPVSVKKVDGKLDFYPSAGGVATGLSSYATQGRNKWVGWPGIATDDLNEADQKTIRKELKRYHCYPVFLSQKQIEDYYNRYSNGVLWPLLHDMAMTEGANTDKTWRAYREVNALFAAETIHLSEPGSTIWIHDYQLLLMPALLRHERPSDQIGLFLHIPFPDAETFGTLPQSKSILQGMLGADLVGLHTNAYTERFLDSCKGQKIGIVESRKVTLPDHVVRVTDFPMGIDYGKFARATKQRAVRREYRKLVWKYRGKKVIVTVDRLEPTKGLVERLTAYQELLRNNRAVRRKVIMVMLVVPSRVDIPEYQALKVRIEDLVTSINTEFGKKNWQPVEYMFQTLPFEKLTALYQRADIAFIVPIRDGMNLVAKEYLASKPTSNGILVLSETAGAAEELKDAIQVDPSDPSALVDGLNRALTMSKRELRSRARAMQKHLAEFTVQNWADTFMRSLQQPTTATVLRTKSLRAHQEQEIIASYHQTTKRLILLDYDGVLQGFKINPAAAKPSERVLQLLGRLGQDPENDVAVISGRGKEDLATWFADIPVALAAEHGALFRRKNGKKWYKTSTAGITWKKQVADLFEYYAGLTPGAFIEQKEWSIVWHYRAASPYYSQKHLVALRRLLKPIAKQYKLNLLEGNKVLEVRPADVNKGRITQEWMIHDHDFILAIGDDVTDEDMFAVLPIQAYSIKVGRGPTVANLRTRSVEDVLRLLTKL